MKNKWSSSWISSKKPKKQRKYRAKAPLHIKQKFLGCHLSKELRQKYSRRSVPMRKGDKVKVLRGSFAGQSGKVDRVNLRKSKVYLTGIELTKKDGSKVVPPIDPSNLMITELDLSDKRREMMVKKEPKKVK